jgi:hypothetical protein
MRQLDFYEFAGVVAPGTMVLLVVGFLWPELFGGLVESPRWLAIGLAPE